MNLSSLRPYEVTDFGETTIHGDDQAKNEECYTGGVYLILHGKIIVWRQDMMEEGVNMIKELIKIKENNNIVSIFCDEDDTSMFLEGYIYAIGRQDFLIKHITPHGLADGYILKKIDSVMHLEISGQYEKKIEKLYSKKNQRHIDLKLQDKVSLKNNIFQICMNNKYIVSIEMIQDDECPIKGVINKMDDNKVIVSKLTEYGEDDGKAILKKENIDTISFLGVDEEDIQLLKRK